MSLILDALRKAERERELGQTPTIGSQLPLRRRPSPARRGPWIAVGAVVVLAAIAIAAWSQRAAWWPSAEPGADVAAAVAPVEPAETASPASPIPAPALAVDGTAATLDTAPASPVDGTPPEKLAAIEAPTTTGTPDPIEEARRVAAEALAVAEAAKREAEKASAAASAPAPAPAAPAPIAMGEPAPPALPAGSGVAPAASLQPDPAGTAPLPPGVEAQKPVSERLPDESSLPAVQMVWELPLAMRQSLPRLTIAMHVWNEEPTRRFVVVNDERLVEGESAAGVAIAEIRREGVVFEYQGQRFLLPRGGP